MEAIKLQDWKEHVLSWVDTSDYYAYFPVSFFARLDHFKHMLSLLFPHHDLNLDAVTLDEEGTSISRSQDPPDESKNLTSTSVIFLPRTPAVRTLAGVVISLFNNT